MKQTKKTTKKWNLDKGLTVTIILRISLNENHKQKKNLLTIITFTFNVMLSLLF